MTKIVQLSDIETNPGILTSFSSKLVLAGGCFDILHKGHISFLQSARIKGDNLIILLESDRNIEKKKGRNRPVNTQEVRAEKLTQLHLIDLIILLPSEMSDKKYENIVSLIKPAIIATTKGDPYRLHKELYAENIGAEVIDVIERLPEYSTTTLIQNTYES